MNNYVIAIIAHIMGELESKKEIIIPFEDYDERVDLCKKIYKEWEADDLAENYISEYARRYLLENHTKLKRKITKPFYVKVICQAWYYSSIEVPENYTKEEALKYAKIHLEEIPINEELKHIHSSDVLDDENCIFE